MLAKQIATGEVDETIKPLDPLRGPFGGLQSPLPLAPETSVFRGFFVRAENLP